MIAKVYVPVRGSAIDPGSGIVGREHGDDLIEVYYEGNRYGYANVKTWADRVKIAADRMSVSYPTVARAHVKPAELLEVGIFEDGVVTLYEGVEWMVAEWIEAGMTAVPDEELVTTR